MGAIRCAGRRRRGAPRGTMPPTAPVRFGIIGVGTMGAGHARWLRDGAVPRARLAAVADADPARLVEFTAVARFTDPKALIASGEVDAVLIATPHNDHVPLAIEALARG